MSFLKQTKNEFHYNHRKRMKTEERTRSSLLFGGKNLLNSLPRYLFFQGRFWIIGWIAAGWFERKGRIHHDKDFFKDQIRIRTNVDPDWQLCSLGVTYCSVHVSSFGYLKVRQLPAVFDSVIFHLQYTVHYTLIILTQNQRKRKSIGSYLFSK